MREHNHPPFGGFFIGAKRTAVTENNTVDFVRSRSETAKILNVSTRTLARLEKQGRAPRRTQITDRICGYRDSAIRQYLDARTAGAVS
jgi:predicted DNA-binding transcriptional regulator AlpA